MASTLIQSLRAVVDVPADVLGKDPREHGGGDQVAPGRALRLRGHGGAHPKNKRAPRNLPLPLPAGVE